jgi:hypothetical protein
LDGTDAMIHPRNGLEPPPEAMTGTKMLIGLPATACPSKTKNKNNQTERESTTKRNYFWLLLLFKTLIIKYTGYFTSH